MSICGRLEDVVVADVIQFIHGGRRSGTLVLEQDGRRALIGFHAGRLLGARIPGRPRVGELLVQRGLVAPEVLAAAIAAQRNGPVHRTLGQILIAAGDLDPEALREAVIEQLEQTISEVVRWDRGSFEFTLDDLRPVDDIALYPGEVLPEVGIDTQMILLQAAKIFDERDRCGASAAEPEDDPLDATQPVLLPADGETSEATSGNAELELMSDDAELFAGLRRAGLRVSPVDRRPASPRAAPGSGAVVALDLRSTGGDVAALVRLRRDRPGAPIVAVIEPDGSFAAAYRAGATAVVPADAESLAACVRGLLGGLGRPDAAEGGGDRELEAVARLRRVYGDLRSGLLSATAALNLMHTISESAERAVLFLVRRDGLRALGAFGTAADGHPLAEATRALRLALAPPGALARCHGDGEARSLRFEEAGLPEPLRAALGQPRSGQAVIFPVLGAQRVVALIYADNGQREESIADLEVLELATCQVGLAFENELLRRQLTPAAAG